MKAPELPHPPDDSPLDKVEHILFIPRCLIGLSNKTQVDLVVGLFDLSPLDMPK